MTDSTIFTKRLYITLLIKNLHVLIILDTTVLLSRSKPSRNRIAKSNANRFKFGSWNKEWGNRKILNQFNKKGLNRNSETIALHAGLIRPALYLLTSRNKRCALLKYRQLNWSDQINAESASEI